MSRSFQVQGFILSRRNVGEADRIVSIFSREQGKLSASARGVRRAGAKLMSQLEPYAEVRLQLVETRGLPIITGATILKSLTPNTQYEVLIDAQSLLELTNLTMDEGQVDEMWYEHVRLALESFAADEVLVERRQLVWLGLLIHSLEVLGMAPELPDKPTRNHFDLREGTWHEARTGFAMSNDAIKLWRFLQHARPAEMVKLTNCAQAVAELLPIVEQFWSYHSGLTLKSRSLA